jgi:hypothetical protein
MSAPAQKERSPAPVIISTLIPSSVEIMSIALASSNITSRFIAFKASGLFILNIAISLSKSI